MSGRPKYECRCRYCTWRGKRARINKACPQCGLHRVERVKTTKPPPADKAYFDAQAPAAETVKVVSKALGSPTLGKRRTDDPLTLLTYMPGTVQQSQGEELVQLPVVYINGELCTVQGFFALPTKRAAMRKATAVARVMAKMNKGILITAVESYLE